MITIAAAWTNNISQSNYTECSYFRNVILSQSFCIESDFICFVVFFLSHSETKKTILPSASLILLNGNDSSGQVFNNPYKKAEIAQIASLEKHVKMVSEPYEDRRFTSHRSLTARVFFFYLEHRWTQMHTFK